MVAGQVHNSRLLQCLRDIPGNDPAQAALRVRKLNMLATISKIMECKARCQQVQLHSSECYVSSVAEGFDTWFAAV